MWRELSTGARPCWHPFIFASACFHKRASATLLAPSAYKLASHFADRGIRPKASNEIEHVDGNEPPTVIAFKREAVAPLDNRAQRHFIDQLDNRHGMRIPCSLFVLKREITSP